MKTVFLVGGGTGGHLFPAISTAKEFEKHRIKPIIITDQRCAKYLSEDIIDQTIVLKLGSMNSGFWIKFATLFKMLIATLISIKLILQYKPKLIIGFGGYPTLPTLIAAKILRVPIALHEQNCFLGKVNKIFARYANLLALNFKQTTNIPPKMEHKIIVVGNPIREEIKSLKFNVNFQQEPFTILIIGGSQGAAVFDELIPEAIALLKSKTDKKIKVIQQAATKNHQRIKEKFINLNIEHEISDFFKDIHLKYSKTHLIISRSGASTIAELIHTGIPAILIPLPSAAQNHQLYNAKALSEEGASWHFAQQSLTPEILASKILELISKPALLEAARSNLLKMKQDAAKNLVAAIVDKI